MKFRDAAEFTATFPRFWSGILGQAYTPRAYVTENLTLEACAHHYVELVRRLIGGKVSVGPQKPGHGPV
jgi:hypothetical protein